MTMKLTSAIFASLLSGGLSAQAYRGEPPLEASALESSTGLNNALSNAGYPYIKAFYVIRVISEGLCEIAIIGGPNASSTSLVTGTYDKSTGVFTPSSDLSVLNQFGDVTAICSTQDGRCFIIRAAGVMYRACRDAQGNLGPVVAVTDVPASCDWCLTGQENGDVYMIYNDENCTGLTYGVFVIDRALFVGVETGRPKAKLYDSPDISGGQPSPVLRPVVNRSGSCATSDPNTLLSIVSAGNSFSVAMRSTNLNEEAPFAANPIPGFIQFVGGMASVGGRVFLTDTSSGSIFHKDYAYGVTSRLKAHEPDRLLLRANVPPEPNGGPVAFFFGNLAQSGIPLFPPFVGEFALSHVMFSLPGVADSDGSAEILIQNVNLPSGVVFHGQVGYISQTGDVLIGGMSDIVPKPEGIVVEAVGSDSNHASANDPFWRVQNSVTSELGDILSVRFDLRGLPLTSAPVPVFDTDQGNMAGQFDCGTTYRFGTGASTGLQFQGTHVGTCQNETGWIGDIASGRATNEFQTITFDFAPGAFFPGQAFLFDADTDPQLGDDAPMSGGDLDGTVVFVTTTTNTYIGRMHVDPQDSNRSFVEFR